MLLTVATSSSVMALGTSICIREPDDGSRRLCALALRFSVTSSNAYFLTAAGSAPSAALATIASTHSEAKNLLRAEVKMGCSLLGRQRRRGMHSQPAVAAPQASFGEHDRLPGTKDLSFADTNTQLRGRQEARLDLDGRQPLLELQQAGERDRHIEQRDGEPTLHVTEHVAECRLRFELDTNEPALGICFDDGERSERGAGRLWCSS